MTIVALQQNVQDEREGQTSLQLVAIRYHGPRPSISPRGALNTQGDWPGTALINRGSWYFGLVPDGGLAYLESRDDLEVVYPDAQEDFAEALLSLNDLPDNVFGRQADLEFQERIVEPLGLEPPAQTGQTWEEQLRQIAGTELDEDGDDGDADPRVQYLLDEYTRDDLKDAADVLRDGPDDIDLGAAKTDFAAWIADQDDETVNAVLAGEDVDVDEGDSDAEGRGEESPDDPETSDEDDEDDEEPEAEDESDDDEEADD